VRRLRTFPKKYKLINEKVAEIRFYYAFSREEEDVEFLRMVDAGEVSTDYREYEFFVTLKDGRGFGFAASTPEYLRDYMDKHGERTYVDSGLVIVGEVTVDTILEALEKCLEGEGSYGLEAYGYRQNRMGDIERLFRVGIGRWMLDGRFAILKKWPTGLK
jgi:hypothetical protein